jgi:sulfofructose kinase
VNTDQPILCVGALTFDTIFRLEKLPLTPGKFIPTEAVEIAEGMAAAQAASIVQLGGVAALWASVGTDAIGDRMISELGAAGVDVGNVRRVADARSGFSTILMDAAGERIVVPHYDAALATPPETTPDFATFAAVLCDVRWPAAAALALFAARDLGVPGILDADVAPREVLDRLLPLASHVVASEGGAALLTGASDPAAATAALTRLHDGFVAVTAGERGCWWSDSRSIRHTPAPRVAAIDTLAAGDVFHGAFAFGLCKGWPMAETIRFASVAAAIKCTRFGGRLGAPTRTEVETFGR